MARWIRRYGLIVKAQAIYASPEKAIETATLGFDTSPEKEFISDILGYLDTEDPPAYYHDLDFYGNAGGSIL